MGAVIALLAFAWGIGADSDAAKSRPPVLPDRPSSPIPRTTLFTEGFESGVPPTGWTRSATASVPFTWHAAVDSTVAHEGVTTAAVDWTASVAQDEKLTSPAIDLSAVTATDLRLEFWWFGNPFWTATADFVVFTSANGTTWSERWRMSDAAASGFAWRSTSLDVASFAGGALFVRFQYVGTDGADVLVDEVAVRSDEPAPLPPENDDCAGAVLHGFLLPPGPFDFTADNTLATSNYPLANPGSCTGYTHAGRDLVWAVDLAQGHALAATMSTTGGWDDTLFLVTDCANAQGSCVAGDNSIPDGSSLVFTRNASGTARYYLIASGYASGAGIFRLQGTVGPAVAIDSWSWGRVKAMYR